MPNIVVDVVHPNGVDRAKGVKLPDDKPSAKVAQKLAEIMKVPQASNSGARCGFFQKHTGRKLSPNETLAQAGVTDGDQLALLVDGDAGGG